MIKAVVFDFDGVLGDTWDTTIGICRELKIDFTLDDFKDHHNGNVFEKPKLEFSEDQIKEFFLAYRDKADSSRLFPLLRELEKINMKYDLHVNSSSSKSAIKKYFKLGKWDHLFKRILGTEAGRSKIAKFGILLKEYDLKPEECVFVTDTLGDLIEGEKVGVKTLAVTWGYHGEMRLKKGNPDKIIHNFDELAEAIESLNPLRGQVSGLIPRSLLR